MKTSFRLLAVSLVFLAGGCPVPNIPAKTLPLIPSGAVKVETDQTGGAAAPDSPLDSDAGAGNDLAAFKAAVEGCWGAFVTGTATDAVISSSVFMHIDVAGGTLTLEYIQRGRAPQIPYDASAAYVYSVSIVSPGQIRVTPVSGQYASSYDGVIHTIDTTAATFDATPLDLGVQVNATELLFDESTNAPKDFSAAFTSAVVFAKLECP